MTHEDPAGCKVSKKRLTIFIVAAMDGHLEQMVLINNILNLVHLNLFNSIAADFRLALNGLPASRDG